MKFNQKFDFEICATVFHSTMSIDLFGRSLDLKKKTVGPPGVGYKLTLTGDYDAEKKRICNLSYPVDPNDAVNFQALELNIAASGERFTGLLNQMIESAAVLEERISQLEKVFENFVNNGRL